MLNLDTFLPYQLSILSQSISRLIATEYESKYGLTMNQWRCLVIIQSNQPITAKQIGDKTLLEKMAISRALKALNKRNLITSEKFEKDARSRVLKLTITGEKICDKVIPIAQNYERRLLKSLSNDQKLTLETIIKCLSHQVRKLVPEN